MNVGRERRRTWGKIKRVRGRKGERKQGEKERTNKY